MVDIFSRINGKISKAVKISKKEGLMSLFYKLFLYFVKTPTMYVLNTLSSVVIFFKPKRTFYFRGKKLNYLYHRYNTTWKNERTIEVPIAMNYIFQFKDKRILEIGDVLAHYYTGTWDILDKYEKGNKIINQDVIDFKPYYKYDLIISVSTMEHVGFDEEDKNHFKIIQAIKNIKEDCLKKGGIGIITMPLGYNPSMDKSLFNGTLNFDEKIFLKRINEKNEWKEVTENQARYAKYGKPFNAANAIVIGIIKK
ncbi:hypothetical protein KBC25_03975 [Candidatus Pacearchaeota archaeon]|nr:hypothetical protein [Candidatus Pacearchaeota archaeon]